jgi:hypothetical protein
MGAAEILRQAKKHGVRLAVFGGIIKASPPNVLPPELKAAIRQHAPEVKALLAARPTRPDDDRPAAPCRWCRGRAFWRKSGGPWTCQTCHPPVTDPAERYTLPGIEPATWTRTVTPNSRAPLIPDAIREKIAAIEPTARSLGWQPEQLWNSGFWDSPRGLAAILEPDDEIVAVTPDYISILRTRHDLLRFRRHVA